jgi:mRNA-degrading endonuclease RelE of RelBE toxin-antitoxin system
MRRAMKIEVSEQVSGFVSRRAPEGRKLVRRALSQLASEQGDIKQLEERLDGFCRLRVGPFRVIFRYILAGGKRVIRCEHAERRKLVHEAYEKTIRLMRD